MNTHTLLAAINDISDSYIEAYNSARPKGKKFPLRKLVSAAACLTLVLLTGAFLFAHFYEAEMEDPRGGVYYKFESFDQLRSLLPEGHILANLPEGEVECSGRHKEDVEGMGTYADYYHLDIHLTTPGKDSVSIYCGVGLNQEVETYLEYRFLLYPPEETERWILGNIPVYITQQDGIWRGAFAIQGDVYEVLSSTFSQEDFLEFISQLLNG